MSHSPYFRDHFHWICPILFILETTFIVHVPLSLVCIPLSQDLSYSPYFGDHFYWKYSHSPNFGDHFHWNCTILLSLESTFTGIFPFSLAWRPYSLDLSKFPYFYDHFHWICPILLSLETTFTGLVPCSLVWRPLLLYLSCYP